MHIKIQLTLWHSVVKSSSWIVKHKTEYSEFNENLITAVLATYKSSIYHTSSSASGQDYSWTCLPGYTNSYFSNSCYFILKPMCFPWICSCFLFCFFQYLNYTIAYFEPVNWWKRLLDVTLLCYTEDVFSQIQICNICISKIIIYMYSSIWKWLKIIVDA